MEILAVTEKITETLTVTVKAKVTQRLTENILPELRLDDHRIMPPQSTKDPLEYVVADGAADTTTGKSIRGIRSFSGEAPIRRKFRTRWVPRRRTRIPVFLGNSADVPIKALGTQLVLRRATTLLGK